MLIRLTLPHFHCQWICVIFSFYSKSFIHLIKNVSFPRCLVLLGNHFSYCFALFCWIDFREFNSVQFSCSVMSDSLQPHGLQHARPPFPSPTPGVYPNSCPLSQWYHPPISSSAVPFSTYPQSFPDQGLFQWVSSSHQVAKVLEFHLQHQSFQSTPRTDL